MVIFLQTLSGCAPVKLMVEPDRVFRNWSWRKPAGCIAPRQASTMDHGGGTYLPILQPVSAQDTSTSFAGISVTGPSKACLKNLFSFTISTAQ